MTIAGSLYKASYDASKVVRETAAGYETYVIGENMPGRVIPYAEENGLSYYDGMPGYDDFKATYGKDVAEAAGLKHNEAFIAQKMSEGAHFIDIGPVGAVPIKPNYIAELKLLKDYPYLISLW